jgi:hypothetical protein
MRSFLIYSILLLLATVATARPIIQVRQFSGIDGISGYNPGTAGENQAALDAQQNSNAAQFNQMLNEYNEMQSATLGQN